MILVGITGYKRSGKDTVARMLKHLHETNDSLGPYRVAAVDSLAAPIYEMMNVFLTGDKDTYQLDSEKEKVVDWLGVSPRHILQTLGTEWGRQHIDENVWTKLAEQRLLSASRYAEASKCYYIFDDIRFPNEMEFIKRYNGTLIKVVRPYTQVEDAHESESHVDSMEYDYLIENAGSLDDLLLSVHYVYRRMEEEREQRSICW